MDIIDGQDIDLICTRKIRYDNDAIEVFIKGEKFLMPMYIISQMVNEFTFRTKKMRKYIHLVEAIPKDPPVQV